ncbi:MAG TPA: hypothetical protein VKV34_09405, partial [Thermoleophilia bacterium]|nr:hypothetical protein [Thermoleophilia bacterium]
DFAHAAHAHLAVGAGFDLVRAGAVIAGLAVLAAAAIVLTAAVRDLRAGHTELVRPLVTGVLALLALVALPALLAVAARLTPAGGPHRPENLLLIGGWLLAAAIAATVGLASAGAVVRRVALRPERLRRAMLCAWICAGGIATSLAGMVLWGVGLKVAAPLVFDLPGGGIVSTPTAPSWVAQTVVMAGALVAALIALARSLRGDDPAPAGE